MNFFATLWKNSIPQQSWIWHPNYPFIVRWLYWNFYRNPFGFLLQTVALKAIPRASNFNPKGGFQLLRWFISYRGKRIEWYFGFRADGIFGIALRKAHSSNEKGQPG